MRLLIQLLLLSTINLLLRAIGWLILWLLPLFILLLRILWIPVSMSFTATAYGPREYIERVAYEWAQRLTDRGANPENISQITRLCRVLVVSVLVVGWVFSIIFTVAVFRVVFAFFI